MPQAMTETLCARCDNHLSANNKSKDRLCGYCQRELAPHHDSSSKYMEWVARGRKREIHRTRLHRPRALKTQYGVVEVVEEIDVEALHRISAERLIGELHRRREEARRLLQLIPDTAPGDDGKHAH